MTEYTIYDGITGKIVRTGATNGDPNKKVKDGQGIIFVRASNPTQQRVVNGEIEDI